MYETFMLITSLTNLISNAESTIEVVTVVWES